MRLAYFFLIWSYFDKLAVELNNIFVLMDKPFLTLMGLLVISKLYVFGRLKFVL